MPVEVIYFFRQLHSRSLAVFSRCRYNLASLRISGIQMSANAAMPLVLFGNEWWTLLTVEGVLGEWLEVEVPEEGFVLGVVGFHNVCL